MSEEMPDVPDNLSSSLSRMRRDWDSRARSAPEYYIATGQREWSKEEFFQSGAINVGNEILPDEGIIGSGRKFSQMCMIEIGCGAGRMTRAMAAVFREVHAVDISGEMIALAKRNLSDLRNVFLHNNNGTDLTALASNAYDFAFSFIVFQHIPSREVIESYVREVHRCLRPGAIFKFQVNGNADAHSDPDDTWVGASLSLDDAHALAARCGFELLAHSGAGTQYFWLWFRKLPGLTRDLGFWFRKLPGFTGDLRFWCALPVRVTFLPRTIRAGEMYAARISRFAGEVIDVGYELKPVTGLIRAGVVTKWCELDQRGEARLVVPVEHPPGIVRITRIRSVTRDGRWHRAAGTIRVIAADEL